MTLEEKYKEEVHKSCYIIPVCHGDKIFYTDEFVEWLKNLAMDLAGIIDNLNKL
jgi:hypothetical protein